MFSQERSQTYDTKNWNKSGGGQPLGPGPVIQASMRDDVNQILSAFVHSEGDSQWSRLAQTSQPPGYCAPNSTLIITLLEPNFQLYRGFRDPRDTPALGMLAGRFTMPDRLCCSGANQVTTWLRKSPQSLTDKVARILSNTVQSFNLFYDSMPALSSEWVQCQTDLHKYLVAVQEGGLQSLSKSFLTNGSSTTPSPAISEGFSNSSWSPQTDLFDWQIISSLSGSLDCTDSASKAPNVLYPQNKEDWEDVRHSKPTAEATTMALIGWIYYGQLLASSFSVYARVFIRLLQMGQLES